MEIVYCCNSSFGQVSCIYCKTADLVVTPVPKKPNDTLNDYINYFERLSAANDWNDAKKAVIFPSLLEVGNRSLDGLSDTTLASFATIKKALLGDTEPFRESNLASLMNISRSTGEPLSTFRERISGLVEKCYGKFAAANKQQLIRDYFVHSLPNDYQKFLLSTSATKIEEALNSALLYESMRSKTEQKPVNKGWTHTKGFGKFDQRGGASSNHVPVQNKKFGDECHFCQEKGHFARDCFKKKKYLANKSRQNVDCVAARYFITLQIGDGVEEMLLDTGASVSILPASRYVPTGSYDGDLTLADGSKMKFGGSLELDVVSVDGEFLLKHKFCVAPVEKCYIGTDILESLGAVVNLQKRTLTTDKNIILPLQAVALCLGHRSAVVSSVDLENEIQFLTDDVPASDIQEGTCIDENLRSDIENLLDSHGDIFSGIGKTDLVKHYIVTSDNVPVNLPSYRLPIHLKDKAKLVIDDYLQKGIIRSSNSEYASPVILVKKPGSDSVRVTIDYRALNSKSKKDAFNCPRIDEILDKLHDADTFSIIDVKAAYHNIPVADEDIHKTAFRFDGKLYEWTRTPFGLSSAPATFNRLMSNILSTMTNFATSYYDDIIVFSKKNDHMDNLKVVLDALYNAGLKLNREKCQFFVNSVNFLGFNISKNSVRPSKTKTLVVQNYPIPKSKRDVKKFLGLTGFYRKLIENYACIASPLTKLQCKDENFVWSKECEESFQKLKFALCSDPVVRISNPEWDYVVKVDSSKYGVGCILEQKNPVDNERIVIEYGSSKFNSTQQNYPAIELEVCGLIFAIKHWKHYLIGKPFVVETDSKAVQWIKGKRDTMGKLGRWSLFLENFQFETVHVPGKVHLGPDALSRIHEPELNAVNVNDSFLKVPDFVDLDSWTEEISNDSVLCALVNRGIELKDDVYIKSDDKNVLVVPKSARKDLLSYLHSNFGHLGINKMLYRVKERYFWPNMQKDVTEFCKSCHSCAVNKDNKAPNNAPLLPIDISMLEHFQKVGMDILGPLPEAEDGSKYVLILQDYFTKWPEAIALKSVTSDIVQNWLTSDIIPRYGVFTELVTDQGVQFVSESFKDFCKTVGIKQKLTSPFHPQTDGMVEKFNRTFLNMIGNYVTSD